MNFVKSSMVGGMRGRVIATGRVKASLLPGLNLLARPWALASSSSFLAESTGVVTQGLRQVAQDLEAIAKDGSLNVILPNGLADPLGMELLEL